MIKKYFILDKKINEIRENIEVLRGGFYNQSMTARMEFTELGAEMVSFNPEREVMALMKLISSQEGRIERIRKRQRYFNDYLNAIDPHEKEYLINKYSLDKATIYNEEIEAQAIDEINEIETAINFMEGIEPDIDDMEITDDYLEEDFEAVLGALIL